MSSDDTRRDGPSGGPAADAGSDAGASGPRDMSAAARRAHATPGSAVPAELADLRRSIDNIDAALVHLLAERFRCTQRVGHLKAAKGLPASDPRREADQIARLRALAETADLDPAFAEKFLAFVVEEVIRHHLAIAAGDDVEGDL